MNQRGFTAVELLVGVAVLGLIMAGLLSLLMSGQQGYLRGSNQVEAQQNARLAIARMTQEIRYTGYNPSGALFAAITAQTPTSFTLQNDWNGNGVIDPGITVTVDGRERGEQVAYVMLGTELRRQESAIDAVPQIVATGLDPITFTYRDAGDAVTAISASIRAVAMTMVARPQLQMAAALGSAGRWGCRTASGSETGRESEGAGERPPPRPPQGGAGSRPLTGFGRLACRPRGATATAAGWRARSL